MLSVAPPTLAPIRYSLEPQEHAATLSLAALGVLVVLLRPTPRPLRREPTSGLTRKWSCRSAAPRSCLGVSNPERRRASQLISNPLG